MSPQDVALLQRWNDSKDPDAFTEIVNRYAGLVYGACLRVLRNQSDAEDVAQECFMKIAEAPTKVETSLGGWLHTAATRRALSRLRSERRRSAREKTYAATIPDRTDAVWDDVQHLIDDAIANLPDELRVPVVEHYLLGRTLTSLGEEKGISRQAVHRQMKKGLDRVRAELREKGIPVTPILLSAGFSEIATAQPTDALRKGLQNAAIGGIDNEILSRVGTPKFKSWISTPIVVATITALVIVVGGVSSVVNSTSPATPPSTQQNAIVAPVQTTEVAENREAILVAQNTAQEDSPSPGDTATNSITPDFTEFSLERPFPTPGVGSLFFYFDTPEAVGAELTINLINWNPWEKVPQKRLTYSQTVPESRVVFFKNLPLGSYLSRVRTDRLGVSWPSTISEGITGEHLAFPLLPTGTMEFLVTNEDGVGLSGAEVFIYQNRLTGGTVSFFAAPRIASQFSVDGHVVFPDRIMSSYRFMAKAHGYAMTPSDWVSVTPEPHPIVVTEGGVFECRVVNQDGEPVEDVTVHLQGNYYRDHGYARTDSDGQAKVLSLRPENYRVQVYSEDFVLSGSPPDIEIGEGKTTIIGDIEVRPGIEILGRVYDANTDIGIPGIRLSVQADIGVAIEDVVTDEEGLYSISNASFTRYRITRRISAEFGHGAGNSSTRISVTPDGLDGETDFALDKGLDVSGRVVDSDGRPVIGAMISSGYGRQNVNRDTLTDRRGQFKLSAIKQPGEIYIKARAAGYGQRTLGPFDIPQEGLSDIVITVPHASILTGTIKIDGRSAPNRTFLWATPVDPEGEEALTGSGRNSTYCGPLRGLYILSWLTPGTYNITVQPPGGSTSPVVATVTVREGELVENLAIEYFTTGNKMSGIVTSRDGTPVDYATVYAIGENGQRVRSTSGESGEFSFSGLSDSEYTIEANHAKYSTARVDGVAASDQYVRVVMPDHGSISGNVRSASTGLSVERFRIAQYTGLRDSIPGDVSNAKTISNEDGEFTLDKINIGDTTLVILADDHAPITVQVPNVRESQTSSVGTVVLRPAAILTGRITDASGNSVRGASVHYRSTSYSYISNDRAFARTDTDGKFETNRLLEGEVFLAVTHPDYAPSEVVAQLAYGGTTEIDVTLYGGGALMGTVFADGAPLQGSILVLQRTDGTLGNQQVQSDQDGHYEFQRVPAGEYTIQAHIRDADGNFIPSEAYAVAFNNFGTQLLDWTF